jgi:hypothetical protein
VRREKLEVRSETGDGRPGKKKKRIKRNKTFVAKEMNQEPGTKKQDIKGRKTEEKNIKEI